MKFRKIALLAVVLGLSGCGEWLGGRDEQQIIVKTDPPGADCTLEREGVPIAHLSPTPGAVYILKSKYAILVTCRKDGYETTAQIDDSHVNGATFVHVALLGPLAWPVESIVGIDNKYSNVIITLPKSDGD